jgi:hypothetical protein
LDSTKHDRIGQWLIGQARGQRNGFVPVRPAERLQPRSAVKRGRPGMVLEKLGPSRVQQRIKCVESRTDSRLKAGVLPPMKSHSK